MGNATVTDSAAPGGGGAGEDDAGQRAPAVEEERIDDVVGAEAARGRRPRWPRADVRGGDGLGGGAAAVGRDVGVA